MVVIDADVDVRDGVGGDSVEPGMLVAAARVMVGISVISTTDSTFILTLDRMFVVSNGT